jgi:hypothetical protein
VLAELWVNDKLHVQKLNWYNHFERNLSTEPKIVGPPFGTHSERHKKTRPMSCYNKRLECSAELLDSKDKLLD